MPNYVEVCEKAARAAGEVLLEWRGRFAVREKGPTDLVTEADLAAERRVRDVISVEFPDHRILGEEEAEGDAAASGHSPYRWLVDPLDGTTNYVHQLPIYGVSIALESAGQILAATVYNPVDEECYVASAGRGAYLNGSRLAPSDAARLREALVAVSFGTPVAAESAEVARFLEILPVCQAVRRLGSSALNLCYLAAGRLDAYWATTAKIWDVAAGILIAQEAGAVVSGIDGGPLVLDRPRFAAAATEPLHKELIDRLTRVPLESP